MDIFLWAVDQEEIAVGVFNNGRHESKDTTFGRSRYSLIATLLMSSRK